MRMVGELDIQGELPGAFRGDAPARAPRRRLSQPRRLALATLLVLLAAWWAVTALHLVAPLFLPPPRAVLFRLADVWTDGFADATLDQHLLASLGRVAAALAAATLAAVPTGLAMGLSPVARGVLDPLVELYRPIPPLAYLPLVIIWCGIGEVTKVLIIFLAAFAPIAIATASGTRNVPAHRLHAAQALGATPVQVLLHVVLPNTLPDILTGIRIGLGAGWSTLVAAELVAATRGLGFMIQSASQFLVTDVVVMGIFLIAAVAFALELLVRLLQRWLVPWQGRV